MKLTKGLLKIPATFALAASILAVVPANPSFAADSGGWIEGQGYWTATDPNSISIMAASSPEKHWATFNYQEKSTYLAKQVVGHTRWDGKNHYSRARFESSVLCIEGDSGRVWGMDSTDAYSAYIDPVLTGAKTYWSS